MSEIRRSTVGCSGMKIKFNGLLEKHTKGCNCKKVGNTEYGFVTQKAFFLPSGNQRVFIAGKVEEINERDGMFLLSYSYDDMNGARREVFSKVED